MDTSLLLVVVASILFILSSNITGNYYMCVCARARTRVCMFEYHRVLHQLLFVNNDLCSQYCQCTSNKN